MDFPRFKSVLLVAAILGVVVPAAFFTAIRFGHYFFGSGFDRCLWPSSIILMATENHGYDLFAISVLVASVVANAIYYCIVGAVVWCILKLGRAAFLRVRTR
jgi:hypothetical protein